MDEGLRPPGPPTALPDALFESAPVGLAVWDGEPRCMRTNPALADMTGVAVAALVGATPSGALGGLGREVEAIVRAVTGSGDPVVDAVVDGSTGARSRADRRWRVTCYPLTTERGQVSSSVTMVADLGPAVADTAEEDAAALRASEERFRLLVEHVTDYAILMLDADGRVASWNTGAERITGYRAEDVLGTHVSRFHPPEASDHGEEAERLLGVAAAQGRVAAENWRVRKDGGRFWASVVLTALHWPNGALRGFAKVVRDLTEQRAADEALRVSESTLRSVVQSAPDGVIVVDSGARIVSVNTRAERMFGYRAEELIGQPIEVLVPDRLRDVHRGYRNAFLRAPQARPMGGGLDLTARRRDGSEFPVEVGLGAAQGADPSGTLITVVVTDITQRKEAEEQLAHQATHDSLTGLPNRSLFCDRLELALSRLPRQPAADRMVAVLFFDLDRFKVINDSLGHAAGDRVLRAVADRLRRLVRPSDTVARFGGDEFAMLCEGLSGPRDAARIAERVLGRLAAPLPLPQGEQTVTASIGIALTDQPLAAADSLLRDADAALYRAKDRGRSRFELFDADLRRQVTDRLELENDLRRAVEHGQLRLLYQPIVRMTTGHVVGVEALVRWDHPERGLIRPAEFIPVAEDAGLITGLGHWVLREACRKAAQWQRDHLGSTPFRVSVNLSTRQFAKPGIGDTIRQVLDREGLDPGRLQLEITESGLTTDPGAGVAELRDLSALGVRLAIDDFGTGYSSLSRLRQLPVDALKVDRQFVAGLGRAHADCAIVDAVVNLARSYGVTAVAEGVETEVQESALIGLGCEYGQGFYYGRPAPAAAIETLLRSSPPVLPRHAGPGTTGRARRRAAES